MFKVLSIQTRGGRDVNPMVLRTHTLQMLGQYDDGEFTLTTCVPHAAKLMLQTKLRFVCKHKISSFLRRCYSLNTPLKALLSMMFKVAEAMQPKADCPCYFKRFESVRTLSCYLLKGLIPWLRNCDVTVLSIKAMQVRYLFSKF